MTPFDQDENERFRQMLGGILGNGPAPYDVTTSMEQPEQSQLSAPYMPQSAPSMGIGGYTPPPAAAPPQYLDHVQGHQFGAGDVAMLGGILAALLGGGRHRGEIAGSLAGQYGGAMMQANARADQRNQQVDQFNAQLAAKDDPLERWKADMMGKQAFGNLDARGKELKLQQSREDRIAAAQAAEDAKDPVEQARLIEEARAGVRLDTKRKENDMDVGTREMLGLILGKQKAQFAAPGGGSNDPAKALKAKLAQAQLDGIDAGTVDPLTGKPKEPAKTAAQLAAETKKAARGVPFEGTEVDDEDLFSSTMSTDNIREKLRKDDATLAAAVPALQDMLKLRRANGAETGLGKDSGDITGQYDIANAKVQSALGVLKNIGVISPTEAAGLEKTIPGIRPEMSDALRPLPEAWGGGDTKVGKLEGATKEFEKLIARARKSYGLRAKSTSTEQPIGESADGGIKFSVDTDAEKRFNAGEQSTGSGTKLVQLISPSGARGSRELTDAQLQSLLATGWKVAQ